MLTSKHALSQGRKAEGSRVELMPPLDHGVEERRKSGEGEDSPLLYLHLQKVSGNLHSMNFFHV
jgi:hypothetical protein